MVGEALGGFEKGLSTLNNFQLFGINIDFSGIMGRIDSIVNDKSAVFAIVAVIFGLMAVAGVFMQYRRTSYG